MAYIEVFTIGGGDLIQEVFNAVAAVFNNKGGIAAITSLAIMLGGLCSTFEFSKSRDVGVLIKWMGMYALVTSLLLYPKATVVIEDRTGIDLTPRIVDNVPLSLALFAGFTSRIGIGFTEMVETVFHMPNDMAYNKTGMLMGSKLVFASRDFQITDPNFSETLNQFMQQCVFYDLLLKKYTIDDLVNADNPWEFIKTNTSAARALSIDGEIVVCQTGATQLNAQWNTIINEAAMVYGGQVFGKNARAAALLLSHLSDGYNFFANVSAQGSEILKTNLLMNAISGALKHYGASTNAPAALQAYMDTKTALQSREAMDQSGRQAGIWMQHFKNIIEAVLYSSFIIVYFLSYFPFGASIIRNYLMGLFVLQALSPMYAIINFAANFFAQTRSMVYVGSDAALSIANVSGIVQANADAMAVAGYLIWPVTLGGAIMLFRGLPAALQSMGQHMSGLVQYSGNKVMQEAVGGNISAGNGSFGNQTMNNMSANHWDTNASHASNELTLQRASGSLFTIGADGGTTLNTENSISKFPVSIHIAQALSNMQSKMAEKSITAAREELNSAGENYSVAVHNMLEYAKANGHTKSDSELYNESDSSAVTNSASKVSNLVHTFMKENTVSEEEATRYLSEAYAGLKVDMSSPELLAGAGVSAKLGAGVSHTNDTVSGKLQAKATQFAKDNNFVEAVDTAVSVAHDKSYQEGSDEAHKYAETMVSAFEKGEAYRTEASNHISEAMHYSKLASMTKENSASVDANYSQEFYEWLHHQPSLTTHYGPNISSESAIDTMATTNLPLLQNYANQFVEEKTAAMMSDFNSQQMHNDVAVRESYQQQRESLDAKKGQAHINKSRSENDLTVKGKRDDENEIKEVSEETVGSVKNKLDEDKAGLQTRKDQLDRESSPLQKQVETNVGRGFISDSMTKEIINGLKFWFSRKNSRK